MATLPRIEILTKACMENFCVPATDGGLYLETNVFRKFPFEIIHLEYSEWGADDTCITSSRYNLQYK